ncbi:MAG: hypothetical protein ACJZ68_04800, partial [Limisphaerales bacterium]
YSDALAKTQFMRFRLDSARNSVNTGGGVTERFLVGRPPKVSSLALSGGGNHWRRDVQASAATLTGTGLKLVDSVEIVDKNGLTVLANTGVLLPNANVTTTSDTSLEINGTAFSVTPGYLDTVTALNRRVRLTTPWGTVLTDDNASGAFTLSATPTFPTTTALTFAGNGSGFNGVDTYDINATTGTAPDNLLPLVINGQNFLGVKTITFEDNASNSYYSVNVNPATPPSGFTFAADGTQIIISGNVIYDNAMGWANNSGGLANRRVVFTSVADQNATTSAIITDPTENDGTAASAAAISSISGTGIVTAGNFQRDGTMIINGSGFSAPSSVTLVDATGTAINGLTAITAFSSTSSTAITIAADALDANASAADTATALGRRVQVTFGDGSQIVSAPNLGLTVSDPIDLNATLATDYAGSEAAIIAGTYDHSDNTAGITITVGEEADMNGVATIDFWDVGDTSAVATTTQLTPADWTVSADGTAITISKATITAKGTAWYTAGDTDRVFRLTTAAASTANTTALTTQP